MEEVKFYSLNDISLGYYFNNAIKVLVNLNTEENYKINEILILFNVLKFINHDILDRVEIVIREKFVNSEKEIRKIIGRYCSKINDTNIEKIFSSVNNYYIDDFFELMNKYKIFNNISQELFSKLISSKNLYYALLNENIVEFYGKEIRNILLITSDSAEYILDEYAIEKENNYKQIFFPKCLSNDDKQKIIIKYINSKNANINYLHIIENLQNTSELSIDDKT